MASCGAFLDHLDQLARQDGGSWWRDVLLRDDVFLAVRLDGRSNLPLPRDPMVQKVATGNAVLTIDPGPRLIVFGFDAGQKKGSCKSS